MARRSRTWPARQDRTTRRPATAPSVSRPCTANRSTAVIHHIKEEETEVFPTLKKKLSRQEWFDLGDKIAAAKKSGSTN